MIQELVRVSLEDSWIHSMNNVANTNIFHFLAKKQLLLSFNKWSLPVSL